MGDHRPETLCGADEVNADMPVGVTLVMTSIGCTQQWRRERRTGPWVSCRLTWVGRAGSADHQAMVHAHFGTKDALLEELCAPSESSDPLAASSTVSLDCDECWRTSAN